MEDPIKCETGSHAASIIGLMNKKYTGRYKCYRGYIWHYIKGKAVSRLKYYEHLEVEKILSNTEVTLTF